MTSSSNTTNGLNRRALIKGAAWSTPVIATAAAVPAYAASTDAQETPTLKFGVFTQAFNSNPANDFDTRYGLDSYTVQVPNITATSTTPQSRGGGTFTPAVASVQACTVARVCGFLRPSTPRASSRVAPGCTLRRTCR